jgi:hypothetical protein
LVGSPKTVLTSSVMSQRSAVVKLKSLLLLAMCCVPLSEPTLVAKVAIALTGVPPGLERV